MPLFDLKCKLCEQIQQDVWLKGTDLIPVCKCGGEMVKYHGTTKRFFFREGWFPHIATEPLYIRSRRELKRVCKEHGCTSDYAEL